MISYYTWAIIAISLLALYLAYKLYQLKKAVKNFNPVIYKNETNNVQIWKVEMFTTDHEMQLATHKEMLNLFLKKLDYRIASYTTIQNTCYKPTGKLNDELLYQLKPDSEKWMETWRMNWYLDVRADIQYLLAKETQKPQ